MGVLAVFGTPVRGERIHGAARLVTCTAPWPLTATRWLDVNEPAAEVGEILWVASTSEFLLGAGRLDLDRLAELHVSHAKCLLGGGSVGVELDFTVDSASPLHHWVLNGATLASGETGGSWPQARIALVKQE